MVEIELFYKIVESAIRRKHIKYLKRQKCLPSDQTEQDSEPSDDTTVVSTVSAADEFIYSDKPKLKEKAKRVKAFNKGIETALKVLISEYSHFDKRLNKEEKDGHKF